MVKNGTVEVVFEDTTQQDKKTVMDTESTTKPKFKLVSSGGRKSENDTYFFGTDVALAR